MPRLAPLALALLTVSGIARAEAPVLRLGDVIAQAVKHNPTLLESGADVGVAEGNLLAAEGIDDFRLDVAGSYRQDETALVTGVPVQQPSHKDLNLELDLTRNLPTGGSLGLRFVTDYTQNTFSSIVGMDTTETTSNAWTPALELVWNQPLLRGLGYGAARGALRRAERARDAAALVRAATVATVLRDLAAAYAELAFSTEELAVRRDLARAARDQLAVVDANIQAGKMPSSARAEVEVAAGLRDEEALIAEKTVLDQSLAVRQAAGYPIGVDATLIVTGDPLDTPVEVPTLAAALERAHAQNPQLLAAQAQGRTAKVDVEVTENGLLPQLDLAVTAGPIGSADRASPAFEQLSKFESYTVQASLVYHDTIGRRAARGAALAARETWRKAQLTEADIRAQVDLAIVQLQAAEADAKRRLDVLLPTSQAAALDLAAERARFEVGRSTNFDVLRRQEEVANARLRQARARADLLRARAALEAATGELLGRYGVVVRGAQP